MSAVAPQAPPTSVLTRAPQRVDAWWVTPLVTALVLGAFVVYATWAGLQNAYYWADPYISPFYSPCLSANCAHSDVTVFGDWWKWSPAILILWAPGGFRLTCYYYRKAYYRAFVWAPPACAIPDARSKYFGESRFPLILQNIHRYFFYFSIPILFFLWWDAIRAFHFPDGFGIGVGTLILTANAALLSLYTLSCHSCRHVCGGGLDRFSKAPTRYAIWKKLTILNERHAQIAWVSLFGVALTDLYVRLVAMGTIHDLRLF
ncbi:MAG TPA: hypothetical protein VFN91_12975 [Myxococcaceae bacterium]|nr:hypothetical protein [Myxococcaceae bacterium]